MIMYLALFVYWPAVYPYIKKNDDDDDDDGEI